MSARANSARAPLVPARAKAAPAAGVRSAETIRQVLDRALHAQGLSRRLHRAMPRQVWLEAVGSGIAARAQPTVLTDGVLHVLVEDHRWRDQLDAARTFLIARVNARLGKPLVRALSFGLAHKGALAEHPPRLDAGRASSAASDALGHALDDSLRPDLPAALRLDPSLREALFGAADAAQRSAARARSL